MKNKFAVALTTVTLGLALFTGSASALHTGPMSKDMCKNGGFAQFPVSQTDSSQRFKTQGDCIQYFNTDK